MLKNKEQKKLPLSQGFCKQDQVSSLVITFEQPKFKQIEELCFSMLVQSWVTNLLKTSSRLWGYVISSTTQKET